MVAVPFFLSALLGGFFLAGSASDAHSLCGQRDDVVASLEKTYSEVPVAMGLANNGGVIEILASPLGSFTIIVTRTNGLSCIMAAGLHWETLPKSISGAET